MWKRDGCGCPIPGVLFIDWHKRGGGGGRWLVRQLVETQTLLRHRCVKRWFRCQHLRSSTRDTLADGAREVLTRHANGCNGHQRLSSPLPHTLADGAREVLTRHGNGCNGHQRLSSPLPHTLADRAREVLTRHVLGTLLATRNGHQLLRL